MTSTVVVEGGDDQEVVAHLLESRGFVRLPRRQPRTLVHPRLGEVVLIDANGFRNILGKLDTYWQSTAAVNLGIIVDRDLDLPAKPNPWPSLRNRIVETMPGLSSSLPRESDSLPPGGLIAPHESGRRLGVWIMPDNQNLGMLETFVSTLIPATDRLWPRAQSAVGSIPNEHRLFGHKVDKACVHTWLAWQEEPGARMGAAINKRYLDHASPLASAFVQWLEALIAPAAT